MSVLLVAGQGGLQVLHPAPQEIVHGVREDGVEQEGLDGGHILRFGGRAPRSLGRVSPLCVC